MSNTLYMHSVNIFKQRLENVIIKGLSYLNVEEQVIQDILKGKYKNIYAINVGASTIHIRVYYNDDTGKPKTKTIKSIKIYNEQEREIIIKFVNKIKYVFEVYKERFTY